jgi:hypothetical protein
MDMKQKVQAQKVKNRLYVAAEGICIVLNIINKKCPTSGHFYLSVIFDF